MNPALLHAVIRLSEAQTPDAELLARFVRTRDEGAFEEVVRRHGPLVWSVCRQSLPHYADAEDAFQAVFLALVQGAGTIRAAQALPAWLHGAAVRIAAKSRRALGRRRQREAKAAIGEADRPVPDSAWANLLSAVHEEVQRLPDVERTAFILCELEGVRQPDAATQLGWPLGTLSGRLCKARQRLLDRLSRRGIVPGVLGLGGLAASAGTAPADLLTKVFAFPSAPAGGIPSTAAALARGLSQGAIMRTKLLAAALLCAGAAVFSGGSMILSNLDAQQPATKSREVVDPIAQPGQGRPGPEGQNPFGPGPGRGGAGGAVGGAMGGAIVPGAVWEYKFVDLKTEDREHFTKTIVAMGTEGWEYCSAEHLRKDQEGEGRILVLVFKKRKGGEMHEMHFMGGGGFGGGMPGMPGMGTGGGFGWVGPGSQPPGGVYEARSGSKSGSTEGPGVGPMRPGGAMGSFSGGGQVGGSASGGGPVGGGMPKATITLLKLQHANADDMTKVLTQVFGGPTVSITYDPRTNQLIVRAPNADIVKEITGLVNELDVPVPSKAPSPPPPPRK